jgi:hypothetical protein
MQQFAKMTKMNITPLSKTATHETATNKLPWLTTFASNLRLIAMMGLLPIFLTGCIGSTTTVQTPPVTCELELASPFVNNMILQRQMQVPVWGWATTGNKITVTFAGQSKTTHADQAGKWLVKLDALEASATEQELTVTTGADETITRSGVLVGEVWFASGQSNMDWLANRSMCRELASNLQRQANEIPIREYTVDTGSSIFPRSRAQSEAGWKSSKQAGEFSALALAFAWDLYEELKVPIGIIRSSHGATPVEPWTAYEGFASHSKLQNIATQIKQNDPTTSASKKAYAKFYKDLNNWQAESEKQMRRGGSSLPRPNLPGIAPDWKGASRMYNKKIAPLIPYAIRGAIWCQGTHNAGDGKIYAAKMEALIRGWRINWRKPDLPFYFTQMQCYGDPNPNTVGFADIREAQTLFFRNAKNVGMALQHDLNPERPTGIHNVNKLDPGKRLARWALAHQYGRNIAYTGPMYKSHTIKNNAVTVQFEQRGPGGPKGEAKGGNLMVASKGMEKDWQKDHTAYVEPAKETKGETLKHFRLAGKDKIWHAADAVISQSGNEVIVTSKAVPHPVGVQYAYSASPIGANLYNKAGLPAIPFAYFDGKQMFTEDDPVIVAHAKAEDIRKYGKKTYLLPSTLFRDHAVIQRNIAVPVWGHGVPGTTLTITYGNQTKRTKVDEFEKWMVKLDPMPASAQGKDLIITCSDGVIKTIKDIVVGDVWMITGSRNMPGELTRVPKGEEITLKPLPLVREFRIKTKARRFPRPRKLRMEIGGGKYVASWQPANFDEAGDPPSVMAYNFAKQIQQPGIPIGIVTLGAENPPLTWVSHTYMQKAAGFEKERDELNLAYPNTDACKAAIAKYIRTVKQYNREVEAKLIAGQELPTELAENVPVFPQPYYNQWVSRTETATHTYNFCISPLTPFGIRGVVWLPNKDNIDTDVARYPETLRTYANSLTDTYGQEEITFIYAQPSTKLVEGIVDPKIKNALRVDLQQWPKGLKDVATRLGKAAARKP